MKPVRIILIICLLAMTVCIVQPTQTTYASTSLPSTSDFGLTGYSLQRDGAAYGGNIQKGDVVDIIVNIIDARPSSTLAPTDLNPQAVLNTGSFLLTESSAILCDAITNDTVNGKFVWKYTLTFHTVTYSGVGKEFSFDLSYGGHNVKLETLSLSLNQCVEYVPPEDTPPPADPKSPGFVLKDARYGNGGVIYAGESFALSATILATNSSVPIENVTVSFAPPEKLTIAEGSSVSYIGTMSPGQSVPVIVSILPGANIDEGTYTIGINISGINQKTGDSVSTQATVSVPVLQPERFEIFETRFPSDLTAGMDDGMGYSTVTLVNKGKGIVSNVSVEISGAGLSTDEGKQYIGNVASGEQKTSDFNVHADTPGQLEGMVVVTYENARGEEKTLERGFSVNVMEFTQPDFDQAFPIEAMPVESAGPPRWIWILVIVVVAVAATIILLHRARKKKKAKEEEFLDDDDL